VAVAVAQCNGLTAIISYIEEEFINLSMSSYTCACPGGPFKKVNRVDG
jgi:hypothetical protein